MRRSSSSKSRKLRSRVKRSIKSSSSRKLRSRSKKGG